MQRSSERFLVTHTGSLPRPDDLIRTMYAKEEGVPVEATALKSRVSSAVVEVVSGVEHIEVPAAPSYVLGLIPWRKRPVAIVDAGALLGLAPITLRRGGRLLITRSPRWRNTVAIPLGRELYTQALPLEHQPCRKPLGFDDRYSRGAFQLSGDKVLVIPDVDAIACPSWTGRRADGSPCGIWIASAS